MRHALLLLIFLPCLLLIPLGALGSDAQQPPEEKLAMLAALDFLGLCDQGDYQSAWEQAAKLFHDNTENESWQQEIGHLRRKYGAIQQRKLLYSKPVGDQGVAGQPMQLLLFRAQYALKPAAEILTMVKEQDQWRVVGYSIE